MPASWKSVEIFITACFEQFIKLLGYLLNLQLIPIYFHKLPIRHCSSSWTGHWAVSLPSHRKWFFWRPPLKQHCPKVRFHFAYYYYERTLSSVKTPLVNICYSLVLVKSSSWSAGEGTVLLPPSSIPAVMGNDIREVTPLNPTLKSERQGINLGSVWGRPTKKKVLWTYSWFNFNGSFCQKHGMRCELQLGTGDNIDTIWSSFVKGTQEQVGLNKDWKWAQRK